MKLAFWIICWSLENNGFRTLENRAWLQLLAFQRLRLVVVEVLPDVVVKASQIDMQVTPTGGKILLLALSIQNPTEMHMKRMHVWDPAVEPRHHRFTGIPRGMGEAAFRSIYPELGPDRGGPKRGAIRNDGRHATTL